MTLWDRISAVLRRWPVVLACCLIGLVAGFGASKLTGGSHTADSKVFVVVAGGQNASDIASAAGFAAGQMSSYETAVSTSLVLQPVIDKLKLGVTPAELARSVTATATKDSFVLDISVADPSAERAAAVANAIASQMSSAIKTLTPTDLKGRKPLDATVIQPAQVDPSGPGASMIRNVLGLGLIGTVAGVAAALLLEARSLARPGAMRRIRSEVDVDGGRE